MATQTSSLKADQLQAALTSGDGTLVMSALAEIEAARPTQALAKLLNAILSEVEDTVQAFQIRKTLRCVAARLAGKELVLPLADFEALLLQPDRLEEIALAVALLPPDDAVRAVEVLRSALWTDFPAPLLPTLCRFFKKFGGPADAPSLVQLAHHADPTVLTTALEALESIDPSQLPELVSPLLGHPSPNIRAQAIQALYRWDKSAAIRLFVKLLFSETVTERALALLHASSFPYAEIENHLLRFTSEVDDPRLLMRVSKVLQDNAHPELPFRLYWIARNLKDHHQKLMKGLLLGVVRALADQQKIQGTAQEFLDHLKMRVQKEEERRLRESLAMTEQVREESPEEEAPPADVTAPSSMAPPSSAPAEPAPVAAPPPAKPTIGLPSLADLGLTRSPGGEAPGGPRPAITPAVVPLPKPPTPMPSPLAREGADGTRVPEMPPIPAREPSRPPDLPKPEPVSEPPIVTGAVPVPPLAEKGPRSLPSRESSDSQALPVFERPAPTGEINIEGRGTGVNRGEEMSFENYDKLDGTARVQCLGKMTPTDFARFRVGILNVLKAESPKERAACIRCIGRFGASSDARAIKPLLEEDDADVICAAIDALQRLDSDYLGVFLPQLMQHKNGKVRMWSTRAFVNIDREQIKNLIDGMLRSSSARQRASIIPATMLVDFSLIRDLLVQAFERETASNLIDKIGLVLVANPDREVLRGVLRADKNAGPSVQEAKHRIVLQVAEKLAIALGKTSTPEELIQGEEASLAAEEQEKAQKKAAEAASASAAAGAALRAVAGKGGAPPGESRPSPARGTAPAKPTASSAPASPTPAEIAPAAERWRIPASIEEIPGVAAVILGIVVGGGAAVLLFKLLGI